MGRGEIVPHYLDHQLEYKSIAEQLGDAGPCFPPGFLIERKNLQKELSDGRHGKTYEALKEWTRTTYAHLDQARGLEADKREAFIQLTHMEAARKEAGVSTTGLILTTAPVQEHKEYSNRTMRAFLRANLRMGHNRAEAFMESSKCPLQGCSASTGGFERHTHGSCRAMSAQRNKKHDTVVKLLMRLSNKLCTAAKYEPRSHHASDNRRPDIEFRDADDSEPRGYRTKERNGYHTIDVSITGIGQMLVRRLTPPAGTDIWKEPFDRKTDKHSTAESKCLPVIISTMGAIEPRATKWLKWAAKESNEQNANSNRWKRQFRELLREAVAAVWRYNAISYQEALQGIPPNYPRAYLPSV